MSTTGQTLNKTSSEVSRRYANALLDLADDSKILTKVEADLASLAKMIEGSADLRNALKSSVFTRADQEKVVAEIAKKAKFQKLTQNFLGVLAQNRRLNVLSNIIADADRALSKRRGELIALVETAAALTPAQTKDLQKQIEKAVGQKVLIEAKVNPEIMGGMIITAGSYMVDDSVKSKLERLHTSMVDGSNDNADLKEVV